MRDIESVQRGERVGVWEGHNRIGWGEYQGVVDGHVVVLMKDGTVISRPFGSSWFSVMDEHGRELGYVTEDPVLAGDIPELE